MASNSSFEIITVVKPDQKNFYWIIACEADVASLDPNGIKTLLANCVSTFFLKGNQFFSKGSRKLRNPP